MKSIDYETYSYEDKLNIKKAILSKTKWFDEYGKDKDEDIDIHFIDELRNIDNSIQFTEKYQNYLSLFDTYFFQDDNKQYTDALEDILSTDGIQGILKLIQGVKGNKYRLYNNLSKISFSEDQIKQLFDALDQDKNVDEVLCYFIGSYFYTREEYFLNAFWKENWSKDLQKNILKYLNATLSLWQWIEQHKLDNLYWPEIQIHMCQNLDQEEFIYAKEKLSNYGCDKLLEFIFYNIQIATVDDILKALLTYHKTENNSMDCHYIEQLFKKLYENSVDSDILVRLEIKYLDVLTSYNDSFPAHLKKELANPDSLLFSEIIAEFYPENSLSQDEIKDINAQKTKEQINAQRLALKLIMKIESTFIFDKCYDIIPWFECNKKRLLDMDRFKSGMSVIGQLFGRSPKDETDNIWPLKAIRDIIEKEENDDFDRAICIGKYNSIGVRSVTPQATDMWDAYNEYKNYADKLRYSYNRTATILDNIVDDYKRNAQEDANSYIRRYF